jgi:surface antigen
VLFFAALLVPGTSAQAASTVLCTGYTGCTDKGYSDSGYSSHKATSYWNMYAGTNCTNYAAYRLITTNGLPNKRPASGVGNARDWGTAMASVTDSTPSVGAIAWWGKTGNHVAYIEKVVSSSEIWVSESNWSGAFDWRKVTKSGGGWPDGIIHFTSPGLANSSKPVIVGTPKVGTEVKASVGAWSPTPSSYGYQWLVDGNPIGGATAKTFTPTSSLLNRSLTVQVTGALSGYPTTTAVSEAVPVAPGILGVSVRPVLSGTPKVGSRLSTTTGTWSRRDTSFSYQWLSGGAPILGATGASYVARSVDVDKPITVQVSGSRAGYTTLVASTDATARVAPGTLVRRSAPSVSGKPRVGSRLTANPGTWSPTATTGFQWYADGRAIAGATDQTFVPTTSQRGATIRVRVTARRAGYTSLSATSASTAPLDAGHISVRSTPAITGSAILGSVLKIDPGTYTPSDASVRYQWLRDGKVVSGATGRNRKLSTHDLGHRMSAIVTYKATGFSAKTVTTPTSKRVRVAPKISITAAASGAGKVAFTVKVSAPRVQPLNGTITVRDGAGRTRTVKVTNGRARFALTRQVLGPQRYRITFRATSAVAAASKDKNVTVR